MLAHLLFMQTHSHLLMLQRPEQSGFITGKSTIERILALLELVERWHEFELAAYVYLKKAFDLVNYETLKELLKLSRTPKWNTGLLSVICSETKSSVKLGRDIFSYCPGNT